MNRFIIEQSVDEFYTTHAGRAFIGTALNRFTTLDYALNVFDAPADTYAAWISSSASVLCLLKARTTLSPPNSIEKTTTSGSHWALRPYRLSPPFASGWITWLLCVVLPYLGFG